MFNDSEAVAVGLFAVVLVVVAIAFFLLAGPPPGERWRVGRAYALLTLLVSAAGAAAFLL